MFAYEIEHVVDMLDGEYGAVVLNEEEAVGGGSIEHLLCDFRGWIGYVDDGDVGIVGIVVF